MSTLSKATPPPLTTRKPSGRPAWPLTLLAGRPKAGKSWAAAEFTGSPALNRSLWIEIGETSADEYGAVPGANYEIVDHDGSYAGIKGAVAAAVAQPAGEDGRPNLIVVDSKGRLWDLLSDEAQTMAYRREVARAARLRKPAPDPDQDFTIGPDLWNRARRRWYDVLHMLQAHDGPVLLLCRLEEQTVIDGQGNPTKDRTWKVKAQKDLPYDVDLVIEARDHRQWMLTGVRSATYSLPRSGMEPLPDFTVAGTLARLGIEAGTTAARHVTHLDPDAIDPADQPAPGLLPADWQDIAAEAEKGGDVQALRDLYAIAAKDKHVVAAAQITAAAKRVQARSRQDATVDEATLPAPASWAAADADQPALVP